MGSLALVTLFCSGWLSRKGRFVRTPGSPTPLSSVVCPHGGLLPETGGSKSKRVAVPTELLGGLIEDWRQAQAAGQPEVEWSAEAAPPATVPECELCLEESAAAEAALLRISQKRQAERGALPALAQAPAPVKEIVPGEPVMLVPAEFVQSWRSWVKVGSLGSALLGWWLGD